MPDQDQIEEYVRDHMQDEVINKMLKVVPAGDLKDDFTELLTDALDERTSNIVDKLRFMINPAIEQYAYDNADEIATRMTEHEEAEKGDYLMEKERDR